MTEKFKKIALFSSGIILAVSFAVNFLVYKNMNNQITELNICYGIM